MTEEEIKNELGVHLAKSILTQTVEGKKRVLEVVIAMCTFLIPSYIGLLKVFQTELNDVSVLIKIFPVIVWIIVLSISIFKSIPEKRVFDFKNPGSIIEDHLSGSESSRSVGIALVFATVLALIEGAALIFYSAIA